MDTPEDIWKSYVDEVSAHLAMGPMTYVPALYDYGVAWAAERIDELKAENEKLREYFEARESVDRVGLFVATDRELRRITAARKALTGEEE